MAAVGLLTKCAQLGGSLLARRITVILLVPEFLRNPVQPRGVLLVKILEALAIIFGKLLEQLDRQGKLLLLTDKMGEHMANLFFGK